YLILAAPHLTPRHLTSPLFPYATLFRSQRITKSAPPPTSCSSVPSCGPSGIRPSAPGGTRVTCGESDPAAANASRRLTSINANLDRKSTRLNSSHVSISYAVFCLKKKHV